MLFKPLRWCKTYNVLGGDLTALSLESVWWCLWFVCVRVCTDLIIVFWLLALQLIVDFCWHIGKLQPIHHFLLENFSHSAVRNEEGSTASDTRRDETHDILLMFSGVALSVSIKCPQAPRLAPTCLLHTTSQNCRSVQKSTSSLKNCDSCQQRANAFDPLFLQIISIK